MRIGGANSIGHVSALTAARPATRRDGVIDLRAVRKCAGAVAVGARATGGLAPIAPNVPNASAPRDRMGRRLAGRKTYGRTAPDRIGRRCNRVV